MGLAPPQPGARAICECRGARVRVPIRRAMSLYPQDPVRPVCAGALGCGVCGGSECVECPAVPPSSVQFLPVLASSGGFVKSCGEFLAVCASARECLEFATVPAGLYRCFSSSHSVPALTGVGVKYCPVLLFTARDGLCGKVKPPHRPATTTGKPSAPAQRLAAPVRHAEAAPRPAPCTRPAAGTASPHN